MSINVGDTVYRTDFHENPHDITTHPGMPGLVTRMRSSDFAEVLFSLGCENVWYRTIRTDKLRQREN